MTTAELLNNEFELIKQDLIKRHNELKMKASGNWQDSINVQVSEKGSVITARIYAEHYTQQLAFGREPGKFPPIKAIEKWIIDKGIASIDKNIKVSSLAFLIARKIAKEGTNYFKQGGTDLVSSVYTPERIQDIIDKVSEINIAYITNGLIQQFKAVA